MSALKEKYKKQVIKELMKKFKYKNEMEVPRIVKVVVNRGVTEATEDSKAINASAEELAEITGQAPQRIRAKKSIATFKLREGLEIGLKVTLRGIRMYHFMDKLINLCLPKIRDFRGLNPKSFDGRGNYSLGIKEQLIFPEVKYDKVDRVRGMDITIQTSAKTDEEARELLALLGIPFRKQ
ncbi:MAG: 50S ribosomal protein L5 [Candidatus Margulisbacteria bacterium]|nr:50S ribosomal protein L5 [Candidatus Margulisiibacteriota bacterium]MBU1022095.1 50S ribosomal protein L5 [Candidatus Margulisiibacteriota bacterium]MBU1729690.1 50S ribosomal protein L5 [Candidatus Margulisiibacteriota bacterium]MBU1955010.1 50S ribosomal protein L5 [Candidatus Margulisiibacteriota bacterium]